jgi:uncharacterized SAM-binding protein YcdF (DUF218 family)
MAFWLKKAVTFVLTPLSVSVLLVLAGLWLLGQPQRERRRLGRGLVAAGLLLLLVFSNNQVSIWLARPLERQYAPVGEITADTAVPPALARCRYIVVLGGGQGDAASLSAASQLSTSALGRITEGVRLLRLVPDARLIVSGPGERDRPSHATTLARAAISLGAPADRIVKIEQAHDTEEESHAVRALIGDAPVALVTSAWHLPRAAALFRQAGVDILPCPADFLAKSGDEWHADTLLCDSDSLARSTYALHEYLGRAWLWLRGKDGRGGKDAAERSTSNVQP